MDSFLRIFWYVLFFQIQPSKTVCCISVPLFRCFLQQFHRFFGIPLPQPAFQIDLRQCILGGSISCLCRLFQPFHSLTDISGSGIQPELSQGILGIHISQLCGQLPVPDSLFLIFFCTDTLMQHLSQTVLQFVIMALFLQNQKTGKCILKMNFRLCCRLFRPAPILKHLPQFITGIRIILCGRCLIQSKCMLQVLFYTLASGIQTGKGILGIFVLFFCGLSQPDRSSFVVLYAAKTGEIHFSDPVLQIRLFSLRQFLFCRQKGCQRFAVPFLCRIRIRLHPKTVCPHPAQVIHGKPIP